MTTSRLKNGNTKLVGIHIFDLPTSVCSNNAQCARTCYAKKAERQYPATIKFREQNLELSKHTEAFLTRIAKELVKYKVKVVRIHSSGDFYSDNYIQNWAYIVKMFPNIKFYAYTKATLDFSPLTKLENFNLIKSFLPNGLINFGSLEYCKAAEEKFGSFICPATVEDDVKCGRDCSHCVTNGNVVFVKH